MPIKLGDDGYWVPYLLPMPLNSSLALPLPMPLNHAPALALPMPLNLDSALPLPMTLPMKMDPVFTTFFRSARAAFIGKNIVSLAVILIIEF